MVGFLPPARSRIRGTLAAIEKGLVRKGFVELSHQRSLTDQLRKKAPVITHDVGRSFRTAALGNFPHVLASCADKHSLHTHPEAGKTAFGATKLVIQSDKPWNSGFQKRN